MDIIIVITPDQNQNNGCRLTQQVQSKMDYIKSISESNGLRLIDIRYNTRTNGRFFDFLDINEINFPRFLYDKIMWVPWVIAVTEEDYELMEKGLNPSNIEVFCGKYTDGNFTQTLATRDILLSFHEWIASVSPVTNIKDANHDM